MSKDAKQDRVHLLSIDLLILTIALANVDNDMGVDEKCRCNVSNDNGLLAICNDRRALNAVANVQVLKLIDRRFLATTLEVDLPCSVPLLLFGQIAGPDLLELLVNCLL